MNTCPMFCAACIGGVIDAFTVPRHTIPLEKPSLAAVGSTSSRTNWSYGLPSRSAA